MPISFTCPNCGTAYRLPDTMAADGGLRVRCARCKNVFELESRGTAKEYELGPVPADADRRSEPTLGEHALGGASRPGVSTERPHAPRSDGPRSFDAAGDRLPRRPPLLPIRRPPPPAVTGRRAFLVGFLGVVGLAAAGWLSWGAWRGRDWLAFLRGDPFEVEIERQRPLTGRAGPLYVVDGSIRNLSGSPKGFFEVRGRLVDRDSRPLAEQVVYAGTVLEEPELKGLARADLERRFRETVLGEGMANTRVEPRRQVPFQIVFVEAPPAERIARAEVEVVGAKDVP
jgi:predicted Zn finger-like uncharacterized protein